jgi:hypothetical protein
LADNVNARSVEPFGGTHLIGLKKINTIRHLPVQISASRWFTDFKEKIPSAIHPPFRFVYKIELAPLFFL